jgi:hypothetical protein
LFFIQCQAALFTKITKNIECQHGTAMEVRCEIQKIKSNLFNRKQEKFIGFETKNMLRKLEEEDDVSKRYVEVFMSKAVFFRFMPGIHWTVGSLTRCYCFGMGFVRERDFMGRC